MKIKITGKTSYQLFPLTDDMVDLPITKEEVSLIGISKCFDLVNYTIVDYVNIEEKIKVLKNWFNEYYTIHEQKYRRLHFLGQLCDDGSNPYIKLNELYNEAELKRKTIQNYELDLKSEKFVNTEII